MQHFPLVLSQVKGNAHKSLHAHVYQVYLNKLQANVFCLMICLQNVISALSIFNKLLHRAGKYKYYSQELYLVNLLPSSEYLFHTFTVLYM